MKSGESSRLIVLNRNAETGYPAWLLPGSPVTRGLAQLLLGVVDLGGFVESSFSGKVAADRSLTEGQPIRLIPISIIAPKV